jgi:orotidine-5'-phosphate decarboxylase
MTGLIVALDVPVDRAVELYRVLRQFECAFKIGVPFLLEPFGRQVARELADDGARLMLDLKLYDTRDTVLRTMEAVERLKAHLVTVHEDCVPAAKGFRGAAAVLAVRALTDGTAHGARELSNDMIAADGLICSVGFASAVRRYTDKLLVCPGIRPAGLAADNHVAPATPTESAQAGADYIVVGRPIVAVPAPVLAAQAILRELTEA